MQWVETTGRTVDEAKEAALDQLGVDERDAEFEVMAEPRRGILGIGAVEARVRARVRPALPRAKDDRRRRGRAGGSPRGEGGRTQSSSGDGTAEVSAREPRPADPAKQSRKHHDEALEAGARERGTGVEEDLEVTEQAEVARSFVAGLVEAFGASASVESEVVDDDTIDVRVQGDDLALLIGPKGQTLAAIQELAKTAVQRRVVARSARIHVDVAGYRERRRIALGRFTQQVAEQVLASGERRRLEPMSAADRKVVHDTANEIQGVTTTSEGEEPRRYVVVLPDAD